MSSSIATLVPYVVLLSNIAFVLLVVSIVLKNSIGIHLINLIGNNALALGFATSLGAVLGSLFYSEIIGYEPCVLCWWQRVFVFPWLVMFALAWWKKDKYVFTYVVPMAIMATVVSAYQVFANASGLSLLECTATGGACSRIYVKEFGYITIPFMSLAVSIYILALAWIKKIYDKNSNA
jgi:disulfide bond formation protein DsbB